LAAEFTPNRVTLSSGGLAEISAVVPVSGRTLVTFDAPLAQIDDVLKSLVVTGEGVSGVSADLAGREPLSDTFMALPLEPSDLENSLTLLSALKGVPVEAERLDRSVRGAVIGVHTVQNETQEPQPGASETARLSVVSETGSIEHIDVDESTRILILDEEMRNAVQEALRAMASERSAARRSIEVALLGPTSGSAELTYVVGAPVWKPTWRVVLPGAGESARFQGWAVLENRSGVDWNDIELTLSSGAPVALHQSLYESINIPRPEAPLQVGRRLRPQIDRGVISEGKQTAAAAPALGAGAGGADAARQADQVGELGLTPYAAFDGNLAAGVPIAAAESVAAATFRVPGTVDLAVGRSLTLPFFDGEAFAERVSLYQAGVSERHPVAAVKVRNDSAVTLPGGIVTVYQAGLGFVGDAEFAGASPGEERILPYALDAKIRIERDVTSDSGIGSARAADGLLVVEFGRVQKTVYRLEGDPNAPRTLLIEHVANPGWTVEADVEVQGRDGQRVRLQAKLGPAERRSVTVTETTVDAQQWSLIDTPDQIIMDILAVRDRIDPRLRVPLARIVEVRAQAAELECRMGDVELQIERIRQDQERVRRNLEVVDRTGDLGRSYVDRLQRQETAIAALEEERDSAAAAIETARAELSRLVRDLTL
jgi:hypothetical protein